MVRKLLALICALSAPLAAAQVRWQPAGSARFETDCSLTSLNCGAGNVCVDNVGGLGAFRFFGCDPAADAGLGNFIAITNAGGGGGIPQAQYLTLAVDGTLLNERVFSAGELLQSTDGGAGGTFAVNVRLDHVRIVCKTDCQFSTLTAALASITDSSATNRYAVLVAPGDYDEVVPENGIPSYVSIVGAGRESTRIRGNGTATPTIWTTTGNIGHVYISDITIGGDTPVFLQGAAPATASTVHAPWYLHNVTLGIIDGSENGIKSRFCYSDDRHEGIGGKNETWASGMQCRTARIGVRLGTTDWRGSGNTYVADNTGLTHDTNFIGWTPQAAPGSTIIETGMIGWMVQTHATANCLGIGAETTLADLGGDKTRLIVNGADLFITNTNASRTTDCSCAGVSVASADATRTEVRFDDVNCHVTSASSSDPIVGLKVAADADHSTWDVAWRGGRIKLLGGGSRTDIDNAETVAGFTLTVADLEHSGTYGGAGAALIVPADQAMGSFGRELRIPRTATALTVRGQVRIPAATDGLFWFDSAERRAALGDAATGNALAGDSATGFFSAGEIERARLPGPLAYDDEVNTFTEFQTFGATFHNSVSSNAADPADSGIVRLANSESVCWEASPAGADHCASAGGTNVMATTGFDRTGTQAGSCAFSAAVSCTVTLPVTEADANYLIPAPGCSGSFVAWITGKTTTGFTINASTSNSDTCDWRLIR